MEEKKTKLTLQINGTTTTWEVDSNECTFDQILEGFLGCMWGQTFVPGTEERVFKEYLEEYYDVCCCDPKNTSCTSDY